MINFFLRILIFSFLINFISLSFASQNKIVVKVGNKIVTSYELKNKIKTSLLLSQQNINQKNIDKIKSQALFTLINLKLKQNEILKYNLDLNNANIQNQLLTISSNDISGLKMKFKENDISYELFDEELKTELTWQQLIVSLYKEKVQINEKDILEQLRKIVDDQSNIQEYKISEIELFIDNNSNEREIISFITDQIQKFGFENTALKYSVSSSATKKGDLGWINEKALSRPFFNILSNMEIGDISKPVKSNTNLIILKLANKRKTKLDNSQFEVYKKNLITQKKNELFNLYSKSHISKIRNNTLIEYK